MGPETGDHQQNAVEGQSPDGDDREHTPAARGTSHGISALAGGAGP
jgi:hypothetical protein